MPRPRRPVSPVPEGPAEEDQLQPWKRLGLEEEARKTGIIFRAGKVWEEGGKMEEVGETWELGSVEEKQNSVGERGDLKSESARALLFFTLATSLVSFVPAPNILT